MNIPEDCVVTEHNFDVPISASQKAAVKRACLEILAARHPGTRWAFIDHTVDAHPAAAPAA